MFSDSSRGGFSGSQNKTKCGIWCCLSGLILCISTILVCIMFSFAIINLSKFHKLDKVIIPHKYAPRYDQPHTTQGNRGTCWAHGLVAGLAHSYRMNGIKKGFLKENEYVPFSVQGYAISIIRECQKPEYNETVCRELQAGPELNTTSGGEVAWLYYMPGLYDKLYPLSLCPYLDEDKDEWECPNMEGALKNNSNPIRFTIKNMSTSYTELDTKKEILRTGLASPYSVDVWVNMYYIPCYVSDGANASQYSTLCPANMEGLVPCPASVTKVDSSDQCLVYRQPGYNLDGEWYQTTPYEIEGGHCMVIQGWNDEYVSKAGDKGGFPIKNSWYDRAYEFDLPKYSRGGRGSHSLQYLMSEISLQQERMICPNAQNPDNWLSCTDYSQQTSDPDDVPSVEACLNKTWMDAEVKWERRPMEFQCHHAEADNATKPGCDDTKYRYFLNKITHLPDGTVDGSFIRVNKAHTDETEEFVIRRVPVGYIAEFFDPVAEQAQWLQNDPDNCGLYWMPYSANQNTARDGESWNGAFFDIEWADSSYLAKAHSFPQYDYQYLRRSQTTRNTWKWTGPNSHARPDASNPPLPE